MPAVAVSSFTRLILSDMNRQEFAIEYPSLSGILGSIFQYPDGKSDAQIAKEAVAEPFTAANKRSRLLVELIRECNALLPRLETEWQVLAKAANRPLQSHTQTRDWFLTVMAVWKMESEK